MSHWFDFHLYYFINEFERAIRELENVTDCGSNREGSVILPDRREFRSRLFNREQVCFSEENKDYDFHVSPVVPILAEEDQTDLSDFDNVVGPQGQQQILLRMSAHLTFGRKFLRISFFSGTKSLSSLLMNSISTDKFFLDLCQNGRGLFALWDDDYWDGIYPLVPVKVDRYKFDPKEPGYKAYEPDFLPALERSESERLKREFYRDIDHETETLLDEIQLLDVDRIKAMGLGVPEGYFLQKNLKRIAREKPQADQAFIDEVLLAQSCYDGNLPTVEELLSQGVSCEIAIDKNLLHLRKWFFADADFVNELTPLMAAAANGQVGVMKRLLTQGANVDQPNRDGYTALELAAGHEYDDGLALLLDGGARIPAPKNHKGALELAAEKGVPDSVRRILDAPDGNLTETDKLRALIYAIRNSDISDDFYSTDSYQKVIKQLLSRGLNLNCSVEARTSLLTVEDDPYKEEPETEKERRQTDTFLPLLEGVLFCRPEVAEMMIRAGADAQQAFKGQTPFERATRDGAVTMMDLLLQQGATFTPSGISELLAEIAPQALEKTRFRKTAGRLLTLGAEWTTREAIHAALSVAVENGDPDQVLRLLEQDADPNLVICSPDHYYGSQNLSLLSLAIEQGHTTVAERLLEHPAIRLQDVDQSRKTALHHAMEKGAIGLIKRMVQQIQINKPYGEENHKKPALILSIENDLSDITEQLLTLPAIDVNAVDLYNQTALYLAARKMDVETVKQLLQKGARPDPNILHDPNILSSGAEVEQIISLLQSSGLNIDQRDDQTTTPLMNAALYANCNSYVSGLDVLLKAGADPNLTDNKGRTAATYCLIDDSLFAGYHDFECLRPALDRLLASGADLNIGYNPLMFLASYNRPDLMKCLWPYQINPDACLPDGNTALHVAAVKGFYESVVLLLKAGATIDRRNKAGQTPLYLAQSCFLGKTSADMVPIDEDLERHGMAPQKEQTTLFLASEQKKRMGTSHGRNQAWFDLMFEKVLTSFKNRR